MADTTSKTRSFRTDDDRSIPTSEQPRATTDTSATPSEPEPPRARSYAGDAQAEPLALNTETHGAYDRNPSTDI